MKWIFFLLISSSLACEDLLLYPIFWGDFFGLHHKKTELAKSYGFGLGKNFEYQSLNFIISGVYQKNFYNSKIQNQFLDSKHFYFNLSHSFWNLFLGYGNQEKKLGFSLHVHKEKQILIFRNYFHLENSYSDNLALFSGKEIQLKLLLSKHYEKSKTFWEISFGISFPIQNLNLSALGKANEISSDIPFGVSVNYFQKKEIIYLFNEVSVYEEKFPKFKKPIQSKRLIFPKVFNKKTYIYPLSLDELLNKKIPLREALLIHEASKDPIRYNSLLKTLPKDTQAKCYSLQKAKREQNEE